MVKVVDSKNIKMELKAAKATIKQLNAELKKQQAQFKKDIVMRTELAFERALEVAWQEFEKCECERQLFVEKAVEKALKDFDAKGIKGIKGKKTPAKKKIAKKKTTKKTVK